VTRSCGVFVRFFAASPKEAHIMWQRNILHLLWEQDQFLEKYLKKLIQNTDKNKKAQSL
jgi:hypothetical protein